MNVYVFNYRLQIVLRNKWIHTPSIPKLKTDINNWYTRYKSAMSVPSRERGRRIHAKQICVQLASLIVLCESFWPTITDENHYGEQGERDVFRNSDSIGSGSLDFRVSAKSRRLGQETQEICTPCHGRVRRSFDISLELPLIYFRVLEPS